MSAALWSLEVDHTYPPTYLADEALLKASILGGLSPSTVRSAIAEHCRSSPLTLDLVAPDGFSLHKQAVPVGDMLLFNWLPVFSQRAYELLLSQGCTCKEFIDCRIRVLHETPFKLHVPLEAFSVIDFSRSVALHTIALSPPIPFHFVAAYLNDDAAHLPPCFRVPAPGHPQVLSELFALDRLRVAWEAAGLRGATFRRLAHGAA